MTLYEILGVDPDASADQIKKAFRREVMRWHPDRNPERPKEAEHRFRNVVSAYEVLADPRRRAIYDEELRGLNDPLGRADTFQEANRVLREAMYQVAVELYHQGYDENGMIEAMRGRGCPYGLARDVARTVIEQHARPSWFFRFRPKNEYSYDTVVLYTTVGMIFLMTFSLIVLYAILARPSVPAYSGFRPTPAEQPAPVVGSFTPLRKNETAFRQDYILHAQLQTYGVNIDEEGVAHYEAKLSDKVSNSGKKIRGLEGQTIHGRLILDQTVDLMGVRHRLLVFAGKPPVTHTRCRPCGVPLAAALFWDKDGQWILSWWNSLFTAVGQFGEYPDPISLVRVADNEYALRVDDNGMEMGDYFGWADLFKLTGGGPRQIAHVLLVNSYGVPKFQGDQAITYYEGKPVRAWAMQMHTAPQPSGGPYDIVLTGGGMQDDIRQLKLVPGPTRIVYRWRDGQYRMVEQQF